VNKKVTLITSGFWVFQPRLCRCSTLQMHMV